MSVRLTGRRSVVVARNLHPEYREVLATYATHQGMPLSVTGFGADGRLKLEEARKGNHAGDSLRADPVPDCRNDRGRFHDRRDRPQARGNAGGIDCRSGVAGNRRASARSGRDCHGSPVLRCATGIRRTICGVIATREKYVRQMPGRLDLGQTTDKQGKRGFVLTLATREQHIRREKATSNICTNQALVALMVNIFMTVYGKVGLQGTSKAELGKNGLCRGAVRQARQSFVWWNTAVQRIRRRDQRGSLRHQRSPAGAQDRRWAAPEEVLPGARERGLVVLYGTNHAQRNRYSRRFGCRERTFRAIGQGRSGRGGAMKRMTRKATRHVNQNEG